MVYKRNEKKRQLLYFTRKILGDKALTQILSLKNLGYLPNLNNPKTFNEKIQWIKLYANLEVLGKYADKYLVRDYVEEKIGGQVLIPLLKVFEKKEKITFNNLPNRFIMKGSHGSGWNYVVDDLHKQNTVFLKELVETWLNKNYYEETGERNYKEIKPRVIIEEIVGAPDKELDEYKIHCFDGRPKYIQYMSYEDGIRKSNLYSIDWEKIPTSKKHPTFNIDPQRPQNLEKILSYSEALSKDFVYVRVDLYDVEDKIYFGELTFTPAGGLARFSDINYDKKFGSYLRLHKEIYKK